ICSTIIQSHRGQLTISTAPCGGAVAVVRLPVRIELAQASGRSMPGGLDSASAQDGPVAGSIAIIDDDAPVGRALARLIRAHSYSVQVYGSAREFLDTVKGHTPACLIIDLQME